MYACEKTAQSEEITTWNKWRNNAKNLYKSENNVYF